jgi:solute carrier family 35 protein F1/2
MLLDSWAIPVCMLLSFILLKYRYRWLQYLGVALCLAGAGLLFKSDLEAGKEVPGSDMLRGDLFCLLGATLYGVTNVLEEKLATDFEIPEVLGLLGLFGSIVSATQLVVLEREELETLAWDGAIGV